MKRTELHRSPDKLRAFQQRARASSAQSLNRGTAFRGRRKPISPASKAQRDRVAGRACLVCGQAQSEWVAVDPAHLWPRGRGGCGSDLCVVPLCRTFDGGCHRLFDDGRLDVLPYLAGRYTPELCHALEHAEGNLLGLLQRLTGERWVPTGSGATDG
jgi:hypothetical protein